jgi:thiol-disulfide isomerase/thioredoxin
MSGKVTIALAIAGGLLAVALVVRSTSSGVPAPVETANLSAVMDDMNGSPVDLGSFAGKPLVINLWATWCGPCLLETPQLVALADKFKDQGLTIVGISVDDTPEAVKKFAEEMKVSYPMLVGVGHEAFLTQLGYEGVLPRSILIKADGTISDRITGIKTTADWERRILSLF